MTMMRELADEQAAALASTDGRMPEDLAREAVDALIARHSNRARTMAGGASVSAKPR